MSKTKEDWLFRTANLLLAAFATFSGAKALAANNAGLAAGWYSIGLVGTLDVAFGLYAPRGINLLRVVLGAIWVFFMSR